MPTLRHKGFVGSVERMGSAYHGKILYIKDLVTYESDTIVGLYKEFVVSVDDYIDFRNELNCTGDE